MTRAMGMKLNAAELLRFAVRFLLIFGVLATAWPIFAPAYNTLTAHLANALFPFFEDPDVSQLQAESNSVCVYVRTQEKGLLQFGCFDYPHSGLIVLLALFLATPAVPGWWRLRLMGLAAVLLLGIHAVHLIAKTRIEYMQEFGLEISIPKGTFLMYTWLARFITATSSAAPFVLWALLTFRYWFPQLQPSHSVAQPRQARKPTHRTSAHQEKAVHP